MKPTIGRIVHYRLTGADAETINRRRRLPTSPGTPAWPQSAQRHVGNPANAGDRLPLIVSRVWPDEYGADVPGVNGQVLLDGNDQFWVTSVKEGTGEGEWSWPPRDP